MRHTSLRLTATTLLALACGTQAQEHRFERENVLGTSLDLTVRCQDKRVAERVQTLVLAEIGRLSKILSRHDEDSELQRLHNSTAPTTVSKDLLNVLTACERWRQASGGAFNACLPNSPPSPESKAVDGVAHISQQPPRLVIDAKYRTVDLAPHTKLSLDALAKGYIIDRACELALSADPSVSGVILDIGGDLKVVGDLKRPISVADPRDGAQNAKPLCKLSITNQAVASSGSYARQDPAGNTNAHIYDPRSGLSAKVVLGATVIAETCVEADALATILNVLPASEGIALASKFKNVSCVIVDQNRKIHSSGNFKKVLIGNLSARPPAPHRKTTKRTIATAGLTAKVTFTIRNPSGKRRRSYRRPYVAVWIADPKTKKPLRTLCLWIEGRRWLRDLRTWYHHHRKQTEFIDTTSRATRRPGQYDLIWDGRDDQGHDLPQGDYLLFIECAREHGTHQLMRSRINMRRPGATVQMRPNEEIESASAHIQNSRDKE